MGDMSGPLAVPADVVGLTAEVHAQLQVGLFKLWVISHCPVIRSLSLSTIIKSPYLWLTAAVHALMRVSLFKLRVTQHSERPTVWHEIETPVCTR